MNMEAVIKELQDSLTVMVEIEKRQSRMLKEHTERIVAIEQQTAQHYLRSAKYQERIDQNLAGITDKLNGLIGFVDNWKQPPHPPS
jgi:hypothetical protein